MNISWLRIDMIAHSKIAGSLLLAVTLLTGCSGTAPDGVEGAAPQASLTITVDRSVAGPFVSSIIATGNVAARQMVLISSQAAGTLSEVLVSEGDVVEKGDVLAKLETDQLETQLEQQLAAIRGFETNLDSAQRAYDRGKQLDASGNISASDLQGRQTTLDAARSTFEQGQAALKTLRVQLSQATILSPVDGRLASASPPMGQVVQPNATLFSVIENDALEVQAKVPEQLLSRIKQQQPVRVVASDGNDVMTMVRAIGQQVDAATRLGIVYVELPNSSGYRVGMSARVAFETSMANVVTVPDTALAWRGDETGVFRVSDDETVHFTPVEAGDRRDGRVIILDGLAPGEPVAIDGVGFLIDGMKVRVAETATTEASV